MGKKRDYVRMKVDTMSGGSQDIKCKGAMVIFEQKNRMGLFITGEIEPNRMAEATMMTLDQVAPGSAEEDMLLHYILQMCFLARHSEKVQEMLHFRAETADMIRDILGEEDEEDE